MRWNCPHCKLELKTETDQVTSSWSFSLCPHCKRFGLLRSSSNTAVKVDRAPPGEKFIRAMLATADAVFISAAPSQPKIIPASRPTIRTTPIQVTAQITTPITPQVEPQPIQHFTLPPPLPEMPEKRSPVFPKFVIAACLLILAWNGVRYLGIMKHSRSAIVIDQVASQAMAPVHIDFGSEVTPRTNRIRIRNGAGLQFPVIGVLELNKHYAVVASEDQWYQIQAGTKSPAWVFADDINPAN